MKKKEGGEMKRKVILLLATMFSLFLIVSPVSADEPEAFRLARSAHPDIWNACDTTCVQARLAAEPFLIPLAQRAGAKVDDLARYSVVLAFDWGEQFRLQFKRPPTMSDWEASFTDRAEKIRYELRASPKIFAVDEWALRRYFRLKLEYGGPY